MVALVVLKCRQQSFNTSLEGQESRYSFWSRGWARTVHTIHLLCVGWQRTSRACPYSACARCTQARTCSPEQSHEAHILIFLHAYPHFSDGERDLESLSFTLQKVSWLMKDQVWVRTQAVRLSLSFLNDHITQVILERPGHQGGLANG